MDLSRALLEIVRRGESDGAAPATGQAAIAILIGLGTTPYWEGRVIRHLLAGLCTPGIEPEFSRADLDSLSPLAIGAICRVTDAIANGEIESGDLEDLPNLLDSVFSGKS